MKAKKLFFAPDYPIGVYRFGLNGDLILEKVFMVWSDAEAWKDRHCPNGIIQFRF